MRDGIRLAILGCGAIAREAHLPAAMAHPGVRVAALVDADLKRAEALRQSCGLDCRSVSDYRIALGEVEAAIIALPNHLHSQVAVDALQAGIHVLCEKPLATTAREAKAVCEAAASSRAQLAVGMNRRFSDSHHLLKLVLNEGLLGPIEGYGWEHGAPWDWDAASPFYLSRSQAGGGVLMDSGVHFLDSLLDWFGPVTHFEYQDDNWGSGIEANAILNLQHDGRYGKVSGWLRLSRLYDLKNRLAVRGSKARAEIPAGDHEAVVLISRLAGEEVRATMRRTPCPEPAPGDLFYRQLDNFVESIRGTQRPVVDGQQAWSVLELIERCYAQARRIPEPWSELPTPSLSEIPR